MKNYSPEDICAVIVSYNPDQILENNIKTILQQGVKCVIVDNGSTQTELQEKVSEAPDVTLIRFEENRGIAAALNKGLQFCIENSFLLMLTMDQDTVLSPGTIQALLDCMNRTEAESVGINWDGKAEKDESVSFLITSGNLVSVEAAKSIDGYDEKLFIDSVDFDFSLRLTEQGYKQIKVAAAGAEHHLGEARQGSGYITHSTQRYYYIYRNHFYLIRKYRRRHRAFCFKKQLALVYDLFRIILFDRERREKLAMLRKGYREAKAMQ